MVEGILRQLEPKPPRITYGLAGFLWLCNRCDGRGKIFRSWNHSTRVYRELDPRPGCINYLELNEYPSETPCPECSGRGWWQP